MKQTPPIKNPKESWKDVFVQQIGSGKYWKDLFKDGFDNQKFLDRSDAVHICKKAQADAYQNVINKLKGKIEDDSLNEIKQLIDDLWNDDDSILGLKDKTKFK